MAQAGHGFGPGAIVEGVDGRANHPLLHLPGASLHHGNRLYDHLRGGLPAVVGAGGRHDGANAANH